MSSRFSRFALSLVYAGLFLASAPVQAEQGLLWRLQSQDGPVSYLFGTMHTDDRRVTEFSNAVIQALQQSHTFMMETLPPQDASIFLVPGQDIGQMLTLKEMERVRVLADFHSMGMENVVQMKPWLLAVVFDLPTPQTPYAQDVQLYSLATDQGKHVLGLETNQEHFATLDDLTQDQQLAMLRAVLKRSEKQKQQDFERLVKAYLAGNTGDIAALDEKLSGAVMPPGLWNKLKVKLLDERNVRMAERIIVQAGQQPTFIAVGAAHLAGQGGLLERLRAAGYQVTAVTQSPAQRK